VNYDQIVNLDDESKLCPKILFHDSSLTSCELFLLLTPYVSDMNLISYHTFTMQLVSKCDIHIFVHNKLVHKF